MHQDFKFSLVPVSYRGYLHFEIGRESDIFTMNIIPVNDLFIELALLVSHKFNYSEPISFEFVSTKDNDYRINIIGSNYIGDRILDVSITDSDDDVLNEFSINADEFGHVVSDICYDLIEGFLDNQDNPHSLYYGIDIHHSFSEALHQIAQAKESGLIKILA